MTEEMTIVFHDPGMLRDEDLELVHVECFAGNPERGWAPAYEFHMWVDGYMAGRISLRIGNTKSLTHYSGQIGYSVFPDFRGHHYAERACRLLFPLARRHGQTTLWITCNPENIASRRTCERLGATLVEIVTLPTDHELYRCGEREKCRYRVDIGE